MFEEVLYIDGVVSKECVCYFVENVKDVLKVDIGISFIGVVGLDVLE